MRKVLTIIYRLSGLLAGTFLVAICAIVAAQVMGNIVDRVLILTIGRPIGIIIPAYSNFAGFFLAASTFLALPYTLTRGEHIRVRILLNHLSPRAQHWAEMWCAGVAMIISAVATYFAVLLLLESHEFGDMVDGVVAIPLWVPQTGMVVGLAILTLALIDAFATIVVGGRASYQEAEAKQDQPGGTHLAAEL